jgi:acyl dehydratase
VYVTAEVTGKRDKDEKFGVVTFLMKALNQHGEVVQRSEWSLLMLRRRADLDALVGASLPTEQVRG